MKTQNLPGLSKPVSVIALGSVPFGVTLSEGESYEVIETYRGLGGNLIDTARVYGDFDNGKQGVAESVIGRYLQSAKARDQVALSTKGGHPPIGDMHRSRLSPGELADDLARSLDALQTDHVELYFLHRDDPAKPVGALLEPLNAFVEAGRVALLGASNWSPARLREANDYAAAHGLRGFSVNQPQWSLARQMTVEDDTLYQMDEAGLELHRRTGLACMPFTSQAKGFFTKLYEGGEAALSDKAKRRYLSPENMEKYRKIERIARTTGRPIAALALDALMAEPFPVLPIVGVSRVSQLAFLSAFDA